MDTREECLDHLLKFIQSGDIDQGAAAAGTILAYVATIDGKPAQLAALVRLQRDLTSRLETLRISGDAEDRHVTIEDALAKARATLEAKSL